MISIKQTLAGCVAAAALGAAAAAGVAHAQPGQGPAGAQQGGGQAGQLQRLHDALHLNPHQEQAWRSYQGGMQPSPDQSQQMQAMSHMSLASMSTPQRLDFINQAMGMQMAAFRRNADATRAFYATLNPDQQHTFDQLTAPPSRGASQH